ncbi:MULTISPECIES: S8 family peptidase [unclassified Streptomyces]|uniref:S8 family peptidase n=1 Tax=unclassified Streptomyces TaxID=2593676 RepID=UPI0016614D11|nr:MULTISPECIES: S8 family serine peptidase [unclassified Streptomyces]MBD0709511.1 peptidase [Streptomyces sp. CBMA291]MBD0713221.1 peptidase [Streptomyces sp. CBMA370]
MRPISRTALGAATAAVLAVTAVAPSMADEPQDDTTGKRPLVGSEAQARAGDRAATVTLVTGDRVVVTHDAEGNPAATALPREDGTVPLVQTRRSGRDLYVYPEAATAALAAGRVDEELFNVTGLVRQGYDDAASDSLPLIAIYGSDLARSVPAAPRGARRGQVLKTVDGVALTAEKKRAATFWAEIEAPRARTATGIRKLWLDRKVQATLEGSTRQVHAPEAWAAGYDGTGTKVAVLDTGADADHPDLKGRIVAAENFTDSDTAADHQGHGTHTLSTVGGSGAASDGRKKGVAPGAALLNGKVLNDYGSGATSWIIAGMEWAVAQGADVVSMSLGNPEPTDCTDPMSVAAEELARNEGTLFVIAAGNSGPALGTVSSPGCAPGVLTVGATDRDDATAYFSSRGPTLGQHTLKPEIAAPGVGISAAAAGGRGLYAYQSMSGTSMATPHVAGAAAIVKQRHPDWTAQQIKAALVASADSSVPGDVREVGGGRLDVKAAIDQTVLGAPAVQAGTFAWPQDRSDRTTVSVPYTNTTAAPVTLDLAVDRVTGNDGSAVRGPVARLGKRTVTVPAGATVRVPLEIDPKAHLERAQYGDVTGRILATGPGGVHVSTPFSLYVEPETVTLRVKLIDRQGRPAAGSSSLDAIGTDTASGERRFNEGAADQVYRLRPGSYFLSSFVTTADAGANATLTDSLSYLGRPQLELKKDTTVVLDARKAHQLSVKTDRPTELRGATLAFARSWDDFWMHSGTAGGPRSIRAYYASVEGAARDGDFEFGSYWRAAAPQIASMRTTDGLTLHPLTGSLASDNLDGTGSARLVDAGTGTPAELKAAGAKGRVVLVRLPADSTAALTVARDAQAAGAVAVLVHRATPERWYPGGTLTSFGLPVLSVPSGEAAALLGRLAAGEVTLTWQATANSPYSYSLAFPETAVRSEKTYRVRDASLGRTDSRYGSAGVAADFMHFPAAHRPDGTTVSFASLETVAAPGSRTDYYSTGDTAWSEMTGSSFPFGELMIGTRHGYQPGERRTEKWYDGVVVPTAPRDATGKEVLVAERQGNVIGFSAAMWGDGVHHAEPGSFGDVGNLRLSRDGKLLGENGWPAGAFEVPAESGTYTLEQSTMKFGSQVWKRSTSVNSVWKFTSKLDENVYSQGIPILFPRYDLPVDGLKTLAAADGQHIGLTVTGHAGYTPAALTSATLSYSYDGGETWTEAPVSRQGGIWTATVNHAGAAGKPVTLKTELTDAQGNSVTQTVVRAYDVR